MVWWVQYTGYFSHSDKVNNVNSSVTTYTILYITHLIIITASYTNLVLIEETTS